MVITKFTSIKHVIANSVLLTSFVVASYGILDMITDAKVYFWSAILIRSLNGIAIAFTDTSVMTYVLMNFTDIKTVMVSYTLNVLVTLPIFST